MIYMVFDSPDPLQVDISQDRLIYLQPFMRTAAVEVEQIRAGTDQRYQ